MRSPRKAPEDGTLNPLGEYVLHKGAGTVTLVGMCSGAVGFGGAAMGQLWALTFQAATSSAFT